MIEVRCQGHPLQELPLEKAWKQNRNTVTDITQEKNPRYNRRANRGVESYDIGLSTRLPFIIEDQRIIENEKIIWVSL